MKYVNENELEVGIESMSDSSYLTMARKSLAECNVWHGLILMESALKLNPTFLSQIQNIQLPNEKDYIILEYEVKAKSNIDELIDGYNLVSMGINNKWRRVVIESHDVLNVLSDCLKQNYHPFYVEEFPNMDLLNFAVIFGRIQTVKLLLKMGKKIEVEDENGYTPLMNASRKNHIEILKYLIKKNAYVDYKDRMDITSLMHASYARNVDVVKLLLAAGAHVDEQNDDGETALILASQQNYLKVVWCLLENNADINKVDKRGFTPLMVASENDSVAVMKCLIDNNANLEVSGNNQFTALMLSAYHQNEAAVRVLLSNNAKLSQEQRTRLPAESVLLIDRIQSEVFDKQQNKYSVSEFKRFSAFKGYQCQSEQSNILGMGSFSSDKEHHNTDVTGCGRTIKV